MTENEKNLLVGIGHVLSALLPSMANIFQKPEEFHQMGEIIKDLTEKVENGQAE